MMKKILKRHNIRPQEGRGQHLLDDPSVIERMAEEAEISEGETVLEIGAGPGNITLELAELAGNVVAYESDPDMVRALREEMERYDNVEIREEDFMEADVPSFDVCVANIPFHLSSEIIEFLGKRGKRAVLLVQKEFAERLVAEPGTSDYSRLTVMANYYFIPVFLERVPGNNFHPPAEVDGAVVKLFPREENLGIEDEEFFFTVVRALFVHSKKKVRNALYDSRHMFGKDKEGMKKIRDEVPHAEERVFRLGMREIGEIAGRLESLL